MQQILNWINRKIGIGGLALGMVCLSASFAGAARQYTLDELYALALKRAERIEASREDLTVAQTQREVAKSILIPKFSAIGGFRHYNQKEVSGDALLQPDWTGSYGLRLDQSFTLNGKELIGLRLADDNILLKTHDLATVTESYLFEVATVYYNLARARMGVRIAEANVRRLTTNRDSVKVRLEVGTVTQTDLFRTEAELSSARAELVRVENDLKLARAGLARLVDLSEPPEIEVPEIDTKLPAAQEQLDREELRRQALVNRSELSAAEATLGITDKQIKLARSDYWPSIDLEAATLRFEQDPVSERILDDSTYVGANLTWMLYDGGLRRAQIAEARAVNRQAELQYRDLVKQVLLQVEDAFRQFSTQQNTLAALEDQLQFAEENYQAVTKQFENGLANSVDVVDANTLLVTAQQQLVDAVLGLHWTRLGIDRARGTLRDDVLLRLEQAPAKSPE
ncbi:MAG: TolC family protein [Desulfobacterales bacterium]